MADTKISALPASPTLATGDLFTTVDVSDTTPNASGENTKITAQALAQDLSSMLPATTQSATTYTIDADDEGTVVFLSNAAAVTVTIPTNASTALPIGYRVTLVSTGAGGVSLTTTSLTLAGSSPSTGCAQNEGLFCEKYATDSWVILGGTA